MHRSPASQHAYMQVDRVRETEFKKGNTHSTTFGVLGATKMADPHQRSLQGLILDTKADARIPSGLLTDKGMMKKHENSERHILGPASKTHIPGMHFGQVPYPGHFMSALEK